MLINGSFETIGDGNSNSLVCGYCACISLKQNKKKQSKNEKQEVKKEKISLFLAFESRC